MFKIFVLLIFLTTCHATVKMSTGPVTYCGKTDPKEYYMDIKLEVINKGDDVFINGTWAFFTDITVWPVRVTLERKVMNSWYRLAGLEYRNFCDNIKDPLDISFQIFSSYPGCPIKKGVHCE